MKKIPKEINELFEKHKEILKNRKLDPTQLHNNIILIIKSILEKNKFNVDSNIKYNEYEYDLIAGKGDIILIFEIKTTKYIIPTHISHFRYITEIYEEEKRIPVKSILIYLGEIEHAALELGYSIGIDFIEIKKNFDILLRGYINQFLFNLEKLLHQININDINGTAKIKHSFLIKNISNEIIPEYIKDIFFSGEMIEDSFNLKINDDLIPFSEIKEYNYDLYTKKQVEDSQQLRIKLLGMEGFRPNQIAQINIEYIVKNAFKRAFQGKEDFSSIFISIPTNSICLEINLDNLNYSFTSFEPKVLYGVGFDDPKELQHLRVKNLVPDLKERKLLWKVDNPKIRHFYKLFFKIKELETINEKILRENIDSFNNNLDLIREKGPESFEWRYYKIREEVRKITNNRVVFNVDPILINDLIILMNVFINEDSDVLQNWSIDIFDLLANVPTLINTIKEKCYEQLKHFYKTDILNEQLVVLLDKCEYFPDDTIPEIIELIKNQNVKSLNCFKNRLYNKKFTISREKGQSYIDEISKATMDLEPRTNQTHNTIMQYINKVKELLNKID